MNARHWAVSFIFTAGVLGFSLGTTAAQTAPAACSAPEPVCAAGTFVFRISSFDPIASAVAIGPGVLVTNRHVVAGQATATVYLANGQAKQALVVPTSYAGDLVLLKLDGLKDVKAPDIARARQGSTLYTIGADIRTRRIRVYSPGRVLTLAANAKDNPLARLHHLAPSQPGNSGGALVDRSGRLVAIVTSGGDGFNEAIPASELALLRRLSGPRHAGENRKIGVAYRDCILALEASRSRRGRNSPVAKSRIIEACTNSRNRQLFDLAGQAMGRAGHFEDSIALFERALAQDPNAVNSRLGLIVTFHRSRQFANSIPHLENLMKLLPENLQVLRLSIRAGKGGGNLTFARRALKLLDRHHPRLAPRFKRFLEDSR